jgi:hypothetical protein
MKKLFLIIFIFYNLAVYASTLGTDNNAINTEINKLVSIKAPNANNFKWACETVSKIPHAYGTSITDKCIVDTDINISFKVTCEYAVLAIGSATSCKLDW